MSRVLLTLLAGALHGAVAFQTTSTGCVTCTVPPDSDASTCVAVFGDLIVAAGGSNTNILTAEGNGFCCGQALTSCDSFATDVGLNNIGETCDAACVSIFASSSDGSTPASPDGSPTSGDFGITPPPVPAPPAPPIHTAPTPAGSSTGSSNPYFDTFCSTYFTILNNTDLDTHNTVLKVITSASKSQIAGPTQCCGWCLATQACVGWVYNNASTPSNCYLKSGSVADPLTDTDVNCVQSGYLQQVNKQTPTLPAYALNVITK